MNGNDDEELDLDLGLEDEGEGIESTALAAAPQEAAPEPTLEEKYAALSAKLAAIESRPAPQVDVSGLERVVREAAQQFTPRTPGQTPEQVAAAQQQFQEAMITDPFGTVKAMAETIAQQKIDQMMHGQGSNVLSVAGEQVMDRFIASKQRDAVGDGAKKLHDSVARELDKMVTPQQRAALAAAPPDQRRQFLESQYKMAAGEVLLRSQSRARPRDLAGGGGGGRGNAPSMVRIPGVTDREQRNLEKLWNLNPKNKAAGPAAFAAFASQFQEQK